jgi:hypothetical protein
MTSRPRAPSSKQTVAPNRIPQPEKPGWGIAVETDADMEIDLLRRREAIGSSRVKEVTWAGLVGKITNILHEDIRAFTQLFFDHECRFRDELADRIRGAKEKRGHPSQAPAVG